MKFQSKNKRWEINFTKGKLIFHLGGYGLPFCFSGWPIKFKNFQIDRWYKGIEIVIYKYVFIIHWGVNDEF